MEPLDCSVVIATRNRRELVADAVSSILRGRRQPAELIVVDQGDEPLQLAGDERLTVVRSSSRGQSCGRSVGAAAATTDVVVFTDDDVLVDPTWLALIVAALHEAGHRTIVTGRVMPGPVEIEGGKPVSIQTDPLPARYTGRLGRDVLFGNNCALHRTLLVELGWFDERLGPGARYRSADDNDFGHRALEAGCAIVYAPEAVVEHRSWRVGRGLRTVNWHYGVGQGAFYAKHMRRDDSYIFVRLGRTVGWRFRRVLTRPVERRSLTGSSDFVYLAGLMMGSVRWLVQERALPSLARHAGGIRWRSSAS